jgi:hypothetical protein
LAILRDGGTPAGWSKARIRQIDRDGRWTIKRSRKARPIEGGAQRQAASESAVPAFGYKNHLGIDRRHGFIRRFVVTDAARHGGPFCAVLDPGNTGGGGWADTAYRSRTNLYCWTGAVSGPASSVPSRAGGRCPPTSPAAT